MTFLPIVARELRVAARRRGTYWVRSGAALGILVIGTWFFLMKLKQPPQVVAMGLFLILTGSAVLYCLLSGVWFTADCLSEEKREGTLGLLFLTDLKGYDVVFGKLVATSLSGSYAVLAIVPILALPLLLGGVELGEFGRMALVVVNTLFFSLALGICVSAVSRSPRKAMLVTFSLILFFTLFLPAFGAWRSVMARSPQVCRAWLVPSAGFSYYRALDQQYNTEADQFWCSVAVIHGLGWMSLLLASVIAPRAWQDRPAGVQTMRWLERWHRWNYGNAAERAQFRQRLLDHRAYFWLLTPRRLDRSPYFWLAARARLKPAYVWAVLGLVACGWVWGLARLGRAWLDESTYVLTGLVLSMVIKIWFALEAGRPLAEDRKQGALELLLSTPLTVKDILRGQLLALRRQFQGPVAVVLLVFLLFMILGASDTVSFQEGADRGLWVLVWAATMVMLIADLTALYWLGMWQGLTAKNATRAALTSLGCILLLPWAGATLGMLAASLLWPNADERPALKFFLALWFVLSLAADLGFGAWARHRLLTEFRIAATQRYESRPGFWKQLLGGGEQGREASPPGKVSDG